MSGAEAGAPVSGAAACDRCLRRSWLLGRLSGHLDVVRSRTELVLALGDEQLIAAIAGAGAAAVRRGLAEFDPAAARARCADGGIDAVCRCDPSYPRRLRALAAAPAVLHVAGGSDRLAALVGGEAVAVVGARRASPYGRSAAQALGRGLGSAGLTVVSGMAHGIDSAAHEGVLSAEAATVAVLPGGVDRVYPASGHRLHRRILRRGALVSELPPGSEVRRWMFPARNRIIAALSAMTVVVQARPGSGALLTARVAAGLGRLVGAVPGEVSTSLSAGPHALLRDGALLISGAADVLDALFGPGARSLPDLRRAALTPELAVLLEAIADGHDAGAAFERAGLDVDGGLAALASLELDGMVRREAGGRFSVTLQPTTPARPPGQRRGSHPGP